MKLLIVAPIYFRPEHELADEPSSEVKQHHPSGGGVPILRGPLTEEERRIAEDAAYKERQLALTESANRLTATNARFTRVLALFTALEHSPLYTNELLPTETPTEPRPPPKPQNRLLTRLALRSPK